MEYIISHAGTGLALGLSILNFAFIYAVYKGYKEGLEEIGKVLEQELEKLNKDLSKTIEEESDDLVKFREDFIRHNDDFRAKLGKWKDATVKRIEKLESFKVKQEKNAAKRKFTKKPNFKKQDGKASNTTQAKPSKPPYKKKTTTQVDKNGFKKMG